MASGCQCPSPTSLIVDPLGSSTATSSASAWPSMTSSATSSASAWPSMTSSASAWPSMTSSASARPSLNSSLLSPETPLNVYSPNPTLTAAEGVGIGFGVVAFTGLMLAIAAWKIPCLRRSYVRMFGTRKPKANGYGPPKKQENTAIEINHNPNVGRMSQLKTFETDAARRLVLREKKEFLPRNAV